MNNNVCQSCGRPMGKEDFGTNEDNTPNAEYCNQCFVGGEFTHDCTMEEMIEFCIAPMLQVTSNMSADQVREDLRKSFPTLLRWQ